LRAVRLQQNSVDADGIEHNWPMASLYLRPGQAVQFTPRNGQHLLLAGLTHRLQAGTRVPMTLQFDGGGPPITVMLVVRTSKALQADATGCPGAVSEAD
jgi:copper(I)-binding protein